MPFTIPEGSFPIYEIGGYVLSDQTKEFSDWQKSCRKAIGRQAERLKDAQFIYVLDVLQEPSVALDDLNTQTKRVSELIGNEIDVSVIAHKIDFMLQPQYQRKINVIGGNVGDAVKWKLDPAVIKEFSESEEPKPKVYDAMITGFQDYLGKPVVGLTSLFGGEFFYRKLVDSLSLGSTVVLIGTPKCGKTAIRRALAIQGETSTEEFYGLFTPAERGFLNNPIDKLTCNMGYIPKVNQECGIKFIPFSEITLDSEYYPEFVTVHGDPLIDRLKKNAARYEGTGFVASRYRIEK